MDSKEILLKDMAYFIDSILQEQLSCGNGDEVYISSAKSLLSRYDDLLMEECE